ncbi:hypothetical protein [Faecalibaculum rodentium]|nr:hypothetical protein [Faecalibaculum rodentium]
MNTQKVRQTLVKNAKGDYFLISTVKLPGNSLLDHLGLPYETMVFASDRDCLEIVWANLDSDRYTDWRSARKGHEAMMREWGEFVREW